MIKPRKIETAKAPVRILTDDSLEDSKIVQSGAYKIKSKQSDGKRTPLKAKPVTKA